MGKSIGLILALKDQCSPQLTKVAEKIGITEKEAKKLNSQIGKLSKDLGGKLKGACTAVGAGLGAVIATTGVLVNKSMEAGDRIDKMSQAIGMSRKSFQEWDYIMSQNGGNVENLKSGYKTLTTQMFAVQKGSKDATAMFKKLGVSVKDNNGNLRNQEAVFNDTISAIQRIKNPTERAIVAQKMFGKSALEMRPLLNSSADSVENLRQKANDLGLVMSDDAVDASVNLKDSIDTIQRTFEAFGNQIGAELMPTIQELANELISHLPQIKATLTPVLQGLTNTVKFLIDHLDGLSIIATVCLSTFMAYKAINGVITTIKTLQTVIQVVSTAQGVWNALMLANPIGLIAVGVGLLIGGIVLLVKNWDKVTESVSKAINAMKRFVGIKTDSNVKTDNVEIKKNALGSSFYSGGATRINEFGGEIIDLPQGSRIYPTNTSQKMLNNNSGVNVQITIMGNMVGNDEFLNQLANTFAQRLKVAMAVK